MNTGSGFTISPWMDITDLAPTESLSENIGCDICIIGAGIAGLSVAYHLAQAGRKVVVLDDGPIGGGETGRTTAHLSNALDERYYELERFHGESGARLAAESHTAAIDRIETIASDENIACDFSRLDGFLFQPPGTNLQLLEDELMAAHRAGMHGITRMSRAPLDFFDTGPCLRFPQQAQFHALKYLNGLARAISRDGGRIFTDAHVVSVEGGKSASVKTSAGRVVSSVSVVVATNTPINDRFAIHTKQAPYRTYAIAAAVPRNSQIPAALFWDGSWEGDAPYHYVRLQYGAVTSANEDVLIVGGEDHKTGQANNAEERHARLESWMRERFPMVKDVVFKWSGQVMEPVDGLAYIGRNPMDEPNVYIATGDSGLGMTHGTIAGMLISDLILERANPWTELYDPARKTLKSGVEFARENLNVAAQYTDWITPGGVSSADDLAPGEGAVVRRGVSKVAAYRAPDGVLHEHSAVCPHLGCVVRWNSLEKTWDCPCHGSRFDSSGQALNGPASGNLPAIE